RIKLHYEAAVHTAPGERMDSEEPPNVRVACSGDIDEVVRLLHDSADDGESVTHRGRRLVTRHRLLVPPQPRQLSRPRPGPRRPSASRRAVQPWHLTTT
ncbi:hypothetical protein CAY99_34945, partial [Pseudomonas aeruginosa]